MEPSRKENIEMMMMPEGSQSRVFARKLVCIDGDLPSGILDFCDSKLSCKEFCDKMKGNTVTLGVQDERNVLKTADLQRLAEIAFMPRNSTYTCILALENTNELKKKK